jgi:hypothetical protein
MCIETSRASRLEGALWPCHAPPARAARLSESRGPPAPLAESDLLTDERLERRWQEARRENRRGVRRRKLLNRVGRFRGPG